MEKEEKKMKKKPPSGVQLISIFVYISAGMQLNYALGMLVGGRDVVYSVPFILHIIGINPSWIFLLIWDFIWCALFILIGRGLWKGVNFVRYAVIVLGFVGIIGGILKSVFQPDAFILSIFILLVRIFISIAIIYYLLNKNATKYFRNVEIINETG